MSSVIGGIITVTLVLAIGAYSTILLISVFGKERYNLDMGSQQITAYHTDELENILGRTCESG